MSASDRSMRVLVTDGDSRAALAVVRSLGQRGHHLIVGERDTPALAQTSRHCRDRFTYPDPFADGEGFLSAVASEVERRRVDVLLPVSDVTTSLIASERRRFNGHCRVPVPESDSLLRAADKVAVIRLAEQLGIPAPQTVYLENAAQLTEVMDRLSFPVVVKPRRSRVRTGDRWRSCAVTYARSAQELQHEVCGWPAGAYPLMLQEKITGPGVGVFLCMHNGKTVASFSHRRLREKPPSGGVSVLCESIELRPELHRAAESLLRALDWTGVAMVEFKVDERDGVAKLMEINGRFWGSLQLAIDAGVDFPAILLDTVMGASFNGVPTYRVGVQSRWLWGDADSLLTTVFKGGPAAGSPTVGDKLHRLAGFLRLWGRNLHYENPRMSDLGPWRYETTQWFRALLAPRVTHSAPAVPLSTRLTDD